MATWFENKAMRKEKWRPGGIELDYGQGMDEKKSPPVSVEDCFIVGTLIEA